MHEIDDDEGRRLVRIIRWGIRTAGSHLDRIRDKTGCRRRADLTRLALTTDGGSAAER